MTVLRLSKKRGYMLLQFMVEKSHSNVKDVILVLLQNETNRNILLQCMKEKNHGNVNFVIIGKCKDNCGISLKIR